MNNYSRDSSVSDILRKLEWPSLRIRRENNRLAQMYKIVTSLSAISPNAYLTPSTSVTRQQFGLIKAMAKLCLLSVSYLFMQ